MIPMHGMPTATLPILCALSVTYVAPGLKDPEGLLSRRLKLAQVAAAVAAGSAEEALTLLRQLAEGLGPDASDEEKGGMQLLLGGVTYKVRQRAREPFQAPKCLFA